MNFVRQIVINSNVFVDIFLKDTVVLSELIVTVSNDKPSK